MDQRAMIRVMDGHAMDQGVRDGSKINLTSDESGSNYCHYIVLVRIVLYVIKLL